MMLLFAVGAGIGWLVDGATGAVYGAAIGAGIGAFAALLLVAFLRRHNQRAD